MTSFYKKVLYRELKVSFLHVSIKNLATLLRCRRAQWLIESTKKKVHNIVCLTLAHKLFEFIVCFFRNNVKSLVGTHHYQSETSDLCLFFFFTKLLYRRIIVDLWYKDSLEKKVKRAKKISIQ